MVLGPFPAVLPRRGFQDNRHGVAIRRSEAKEYTYLGRTAIKEMAESGYIHLSHSVSNLVYHFVCPAKYRRVVIDEAVDECIRQTCVGISLRYEWIEFLEIGTDRDHVHFLIQSDPSHSPGEIIRVVKSITAKRVFAEHPEVKKQLWGRRILERRIFCLQCWEEHERVSDKGICEESRYTRCV